MNASDMSTARETEAVVDCASLSFLPILELCLVCPFQCIAYIRVLTITEVLLHSFKQVGSSYPFC